jgi:L-serine dehydratase
MAISVFDLFKIGIGPSSSHTVGPMRAAALFVQDLRERDLLQQVQRVEVQLYGSLSATGMGHGSDNAVIMGLMGEWPDAIDPALIGSAHRDPARDARRCCSTATCPVPFVWSRDMRLIDENLPFHPNAMTLVASTATTASCIATPITRWAAVLWWTQAQAASGVADMDRTELPYDFSSAVELLELCRTHHLSVAALMLANERTWRSEDEIRCGLMKLWRAMQDCVEQGLKHEGILPGGLNVRRRAAQVAPQPAGAGQTECHRLDPERDGMGQPVCPGGQRRKRRRRAHGHGTHQRRGGDHPGGAALLYEIQRGSQRGQCGGLLPKRGGHRHFVQKERLDLRRRSGLPG